MVKEQHGEKNEHPHPFPPPSEGEGQGEGENTPSADADTPLKEGNFPSTQWEEENRNSPFEKGG